MAAADLSACRARTALQQHPCSVVELNMAPLPVLPLRGRFPLAGRDMTSRIDAIEGRWQGSDRKVGLGADDARRSLIGAHRAILGRF